MTNMKRMLWSAAAVAAIAIGTFSFAIAGRKTGAVSYTPGGAAADNAVSGASTTPAPAPTAAKTIPAVGTARRGSDDDNGSEEGQYSGATTKAPANTAPVATTPTPQPAPANGSTAAATEYKNGTYSATGSYDSPGGMEQIGVTLTIQNDVVTGASVSPMPSDGTSARYQNMFASGYKAQVVGQSVDSINLQYVSGSSLTPIGFDNALASIKTQAKA